MTEGGMSAGKVKKKVAENYERIKASKNIHYY